MNNYKEIPKLFLKGAFKSFIILICGIAVGFLLLCLVHLLPIDKMYQNVLTSKDVINSHAQLIPGYESTAIDNYTDSIMLNEAICDVDASLVDKVINNYQVNYFRQYDQQENLLKYLEGEKGYQYQGYSHYWGGHQVVLKVLLLLFDYSDILVINIIIQFLLMILIIVGLCRHEKQYMVIPFFTAVISIMPFVIAVCLQYSDVFYIALAGSLLIVWQYENIRKERMYIIFLLLGMLTSYFDFLTYPFVSLGIPLVFLLTYLEDETLVRKIFYMAQNSILWCLGYAGMWAGKWILGSILSPESGSMHEALSSISYRGSNITDEGVVNVFDVLMKNLYVYLKWPIILLIGLSVIYFIFQIIRKKKFNRFNLLPCIPYLLVCLYPIAWYMIAKNHSYEHAFMAYRELSIATFAGVSMLAVLGEGKRKALKI